MPDHHIIIIRIEWMGGGVIIGTFYIKLNLGVARRRKCQRKRGKKMKVEPIDYLKPIRTRWEGVFSLNRAKFFKMKRIIRSRKRVCVLCVYKSICGLYNS